MRRWHADPAGPAFRADAAGPARELPVVSIGDGDVLRCDGRVEAQALGGARADPGVARLHVARCDGPVRTHRASDGALVQLASADDRASRAEMLLTYLRLAGRADAGERFDAASRDAAFHLRWAAMREWLALDARAALPRLAEMAECDPHQEIRAVAQSMRHLVTSRIAAPCLA